MRLALQSTAQNDRLRITFLYDHDMCTGGEVGITGKVLQCQVALFGHIRILSSITSVLHS